MQKPAIIGLALFLAAAALVALSWAGVALWRPLEVLILVIPLVAIAALSLFVFHLCLAPRLRLKRLQRLRVKQGRRHPLA